ncbi:hypothetical protein JKV81_21795 [Streptomyces sp. For3]|uniref:hypothetical protein n=1 Tax=Streptomyces silvae TaxID=2803812 RepID=UPI0019215E70|nr:hypothetical protein [Streptomyces silvae]MBL1289463.1 hypothetical protein [Streptomyces silvae]
MRTRTENAARVVVTGAGTAGGVPSGGPAAVATLARTRQDDDALPAGTSPLHLLTNDGGF